MSRQHSAGKGDSPRPIGDYKKWSENWDKIFNKRKKKIEKIKKEDKKK